MTTYYLQKSKIFRHYNYDNFDKCAPVNENYENKASQTEHSPTGRLSAHLSAHGIEFQQYLNVTIQNTDHSNQTTSRDRPEEVLFNPVKSLFLC